MDKLRICFFFHCFDGGGAERMTIALANELCARGHDITFLLRNSEGPLKELLSPSVRVIDMRLPKKGRFRKNLGNVRFLRYAMRSEHFDVMVSVTAEMSQVAAVSTLFLRKRMPLVSVVHNTLSKEVHSFQRIREFLFPLVNRRYDRVIAVSGAVKEDYITVCHAPRDQVAVVYNPVIAPDFWERANERIAHPWLNKERGFVTLVQAGRLCSAKNHSLMLKALQLLNESGDYRLILLGDGELKESLIQEAVKLGISMRVDFAGFVPNPLPYFKNADAVVLSSRFEGLPTVLIEALAVGARLVSTDCPSGPAEILKNGELGVLVENHCPKALSEGIRLALSREWDGEARKSRSLDFTSEKSADGYLKIFKEAVKGA